MVVIHVQVYFVEKIWNWPKFAVHCGGVHYKCDIMLLCCVFTCATMWPITVVMKFIFTFMTCMFDAMSRAYLCIYLNMLNSLICFNTEQTCLFLEIYMKMFSIKKWCILQDCSTLRKKHTGKTCKSVRLSLGSHKQMHMIKVHLLQRHHCALLVRVDTGVESVSLCHRLTTCQKYIYFGAQYVLSHSFSAVTPHRLPLIVIQWTLPIPLVLSVWIFNVHKIAWGPYVLLHTFAYFYTCTDRYIWQ